MNEIETSKPILLLAGVAVLSAVLAVLQFALFEDPVPVPVAQVEEAPPPEPESGTKPSPVASASTEKLVAAVKAGKLEAVKQQLQACRRAKACDLDEGLRLSVEADRPEITKALLDAGANANTRDRKGETPLHLAAEKGGTAVTKALLGAGAKVDALDEDGATPLHSAAAWGNVDLAKTLLDAGARIDAVDGNRETALHLVASRRIPPLSVYADVAKLLLRSGASVNARAADGTTPLDAAKASAQRVCLEGNRKACADANEVVAILRGGGGSERPDSLF